jgi:hypothetical protein
MLLTILFSLLLSLMTTKSCSCEGLLELILSDSSKSVDIVPAGMMLNERLRIILPIVVAPFILYAGSRGLFY